MQDAKILTMHCIVRLFQMEILKWESVSFKLLTGIFIENFTKIEVLRLTHGFLNEHELIPPKE